MRPTTVKPLIFLLSVFLFSACNSNTQPSAPTSSASSVSSPAAPAANSPDDQDNSKVCALFSDVDAQKIMNAPMKPKPGHGKIVCMYEEATQRPNSIGPGTVALTLNQYQSADEANRAWARLKETRHLEAGQKNVQVLNGIGDEAYFTGNIEKGKVGVSGVILRKGNSNFALDVMVLDYIASPDALKSMAKQIAAKL